MRLLDRILQQAQLGGAGDLHLIAPRGLPHFTVHYRSQRVSLTKELYPGILWVELLEQIKFQCGYRTDRRLEFQDGVFHHDHMSLRVAFTPYPCDYLTLRRHDLQATAKLPDCPLKTNFLDRWSEDFNILLIAGGLHSGKTTFYYDALERQAQKNRTVLSLEDPIEKPSAHFFQMPYYSDRAQGVASSLVRFDPDVVGLGEVRRDQDWDLLHFLSLSSIRTLSTCHGSSLSAIHIKIQQASKHNPDLSKGIYGIVFLKELKSVPQYYIFEESHAHLVLL